MIKKILLNAILLLLCLNTIHSLVIPFKSNQDNTLLLDQFVRIDPPDAQAISLKTQAFLNYDQENLYVKFVCEIDSTFTMGIKNKRDIMPSSDYLRVTLITDTKSDQGYCFYMFPLGSLADAIRKSDFSSDYEWNSEYSYTTKISDQWIVDVKIPFSDLRFQGSAPYHWKLILTRNYEKSDETFSIPFGTINQGLSYFREALDVQLNKEIKSSFKHKINPFIFYKIDRLDDQQENAQADIGVDSEFQLNNSHKIKLSINPDFSDVPPDVFKDVYNSRYRLTYDENRFFFIEDFNVLGMGASLFNTRNIVDPDYAVKFSGKSKDWHYGALLAQDKEIYSGETITNLPFQYHALGTKYNKENFKLQMSYADRTYHDDFNRIYVIESDYTYQKKLLCSAYYHMSETKNSNTSLSRGAEYGVNTKLYFLKASEINSGINITKKDFNPEFGDTNETDLLSMNVKMKNRFDLNQYHIRYIATEGLVLKSERISNHELFQRALTFSVDLQTDFKLKIYSKINCLKQVYKEKTHEYYDSNVQTIYYPYSFATFTLVYLNGKTIYYRLNRTMPRTNYIALISGQIHKAVSYRIEARRIIYPDLKKTEINLYQDDDQYSIINYDMTYNFTNDLSLNAGIRFDDYQKQSLENSFAYFINLRVQVNDILKFYAGYNLSGATYNDNYEADIDKFYLKCLLEF